MILQNFLPNKFIKFMPLLAILLMALLLAGCGENPTSTTTPTTATPTLAATNTPSPITTRAVSTTSSSTTKAVTTTQTATTPVASSSVIMPAAYPGAVLLDLPPQAQQAFSDFSGKMDLKDPTYQVFIINEDPAKIRDYYSKGWLDQDYHTGTQIKLRSNQVVTISEFYVKDTSEVAVVATGPLDKGYIQLLTGEVPALEGKLKAGDTIFAVVSGTWVPFE